MAASNFVSNVWRQSAGALRRAILLFAMSQSFLVSTAIAAPSDHEGDKVETIVVTARRATRVDIAAEGESRYRMSSEDIVNLPAGVDTALTDMLSQMPGVSIDQNEQIHIRDTEGPQFQYRIDGVMVPLDINTNPTFVSMFGSRMIGQVDLLTGVLPAQYSYATGGIVDIRTKSGCDDAGGNVALFGGQRGTFQPSLEYGGCEGAFGYYVNALYRQSNTAFSSATPGPDAIHDRTNQGQGFGYFTYAPDANTRIGVMISAAASNNQLPNVPDLAPQFTLTGVQPKPSADIDSYLNFRDTVGIVSLQGVLEPRLTYRLAYSAHFISEEFRPDRDGELIYQGVASNASHRDIDHALQGDVNWSTASHDIGAGFYLGSYRVAARVSSLVFPLDPVSGTPGSSPIVIANDSHATNVLGGLYVNDLWQVGEKLRVNLGVRLDTLTGFTHRSQIDPTINLSYLAAPGTNFHAGFARYMQVPSFLGISPDVPASFANTTAAGPSGSTTPLTEDDYEWDAGLVHAFSPELTISEDNYYEITHHYLDTGQFGVVPIFAPFNYSRGYMWGSEIALDYRQRGLSAYANLTVGQNLQRGVSTGQFNFPADELAYIDNHHIVLDHQPLVGVGAGATYSWRDYRFSIDGIYSSGLRAGFADGEKLPNVVQVNAGVERRFDMPGVGIVVDRIVLLNIFDRVNLIRPAEGIGIFQSAYGPRFTVYDTLTFPL